jgi:hypothetical protein
MAQFEQWAARELAKHGSRESKAARLASELSFQALMADIKRPASVSARQWAESGKGHALLIAQLKAALAA